MGGGGGGGGGGIKNEWLISRHMLGLLKYIYFIKVHSNIYKLHNYTMQEGRIRAKAVS